MRQSTIDEYFNPNFSKPRSDQTTIDMYFPKQPKETSNTSNVAEQQPFFQINIDFWGELENCELPEIGYSFDSDPFWQQYYYPELNDLGVSEDFVNQYSNFGLMGDDVPKISF